MIIIALKHRLNEENQNVLRFGKGNTKQKIYLSSKVAAQWNIFSKM